MTLGPYDFVQPERASLPPCRLAKRRHMSSNIHAGTEQMAAQLEARQTIRQRWKHDAGDLLIAHELAFSALSSMIDRFSGRKFAHQPKAIEGRLSLLAQFVQGVEICETAISEGLSSQAAALLKQELETLAAVDEFTLNTRRDGVTPNIKNGPLSGFGPLYGELNNIAHPSRHDVVRQLATIETGSICAPTTIPQYNAELIRLFYGYHVYFIVEMTKRAAAVFRHLFNEELSDDEAHWASRALAILLEEKVINFHPEVPPISWTPEHLCSRSPQWPESTHRTRRSSGGK